MQKTRTKHHNDKVDNLINLLYSSLTDIDYYEWNRIALNSSSVLGIDIDSVNLLSYESKLLIENMVGYYDNKIDTDGLITINPIADVNNMMIRTNVFVENYKIDTDTNTTFRKIIEGTDDNITGFFINYDDNYLVDNYNIYSTSYINMFSNRTYKNNSRLSQIPICELLGGIYSTDIGILIGDNIITTNAIDVNNMNLVIDCNDNVNINSTIINLNVNDLDTNTLDESNSRTINIDASEIQLYGTQILLSMLETKNDKIIIRNMKDSSDVEIGDFELIYYDDEGVKKLAGKKI